MTLRVVELFSGIGAQRMALTLAGIPHEVVAISEIDKHALASYEAIWGDCPNLGDIREVKALPPCDLVTYSFPCQDLSVAGARKGMAEGSGTRSGLVWEVMRLLEGERERPEWLLMENVPNVLTAPEWPQLVGRLEAMGYCNLWAKLDSSEFGSAQKRIRAFMVSRLVVAPPELPVKAPNAPMLCLKDIMEPERDEKYIRHIPMDRIKWRASPSSQGIKVLADWDREHSNEMANRLYSSSHMSPTLVTHGGGGRDIKIVADDRGISYERHARLYSDDGKSPTIDLLGRHGSHSIKIIDGSSDAGSLKVCVLTPRESWRLMGFPEWAYLRAARVSSKTQLYNQAGNSIVVEVLEAIFRAMFLTIQVKKHDNRRIQGRI